MDLNHPYNTAGPAFVITTAAFSLPLALLVTAAYMNYQIQNTYKKNASDSKQPVTHGIYRLFDKSPEPLPSELVTPTNSQAGIS